MGTSTSPSVPPKLTWMERSIYDGMKTSVIHAGEFKDSCDINSGVRQGSLLSSFLFLLAADFIMKRMTEERGGGIQWTLTTQLNDMDFDGIALLSHTYKQMQDKTNAIADISAAVGLKMNTKQTKNLRNKNANCKGIIKIQDTLLEDIKDFLGSISDKSGGAEDIRARIQLARR